MKTEFFTTEAEAMEFLSIEGGEIQKLEETTFRLPEAFFLHLAVSEAAFAAAVRAHAAGCGMSLEAAWNDALDGEVKGAPAAAMAALDSQFRARVALPPRWMVTVSEPETAHRSSSIDAGQPGNEEGAWGSSSSDGWLVD